MSKVLVALVSALTILEVVADWDPRAPGPFDADEGITFKICASGRAKGWEAFVVAPTVVEPATVPAAAFLPGFAAKAGMYSSFHGHIASHGIGVIGFSVPPLHVSTEGIIGRSADAQALLECIFENGGADFHARYRAAGGNKNLTFDVVNQMGLMAHSTGGHTLLHVIDHMSCFNAKFVALFDPVDGIDPYGFEAQYLIPRGTNSSNRLNFSAPVALVVSGLAAQALHIAKVLPWPACAPAEVAGLHWYASLDSPKWLLNFTDYGHVDLIEDIFQGAGGFVCPSGPGAATAEGRAEYRARLGAVVVALAHAVLPAVPKSPQLPQAEYLRWLKDPSAMAPLKVTSQSDEGSVPVVGHCSRHDAVAATLVV